MTKLFASLLCWACLLASPPGVSSQDGNATDLFDFDNTTMISNITTTTISHNSTPLLDFSGFVPVTVPGLQEMNGVLIRVGCPSSSSLGCLCPVGIRWTIEPIQGDQIVLSMQPANILLASIKSETPALNNAKTYNTLQFTYTDTALRTPPPPLTGVRLQVPVHNKLRYIGVTDGNRVQVLKGIQSLEHIAVTESSGLFANITTTISSPPLQLSVNRRSLVNMSVVEPVDDMTLESAPVATDSSVVVASNSRTTDTNSSVIIPGPVQITAMDSSRVFLKGVVQGGSVESRSSVNVMGSIEALFVTGGATVTVSQEGSCSKVDIAMFAGTCLEKSDVAVLARQRNTTFNNTAIQCGGTNNPVDDEDKMDDSSATTWQRLSAVTTLVAGMTALVLQL